MNKIKLIEVKDVEPKNTLVYSVQCKHCGKRNEVEVINKDIIMLRINDELDVAKIRIERILNGVK